MTWVTADAGSIGLYAGSSVVEGGCNFTFIDWKKNVFLTSPWSVMGLVTEYKRDWLHIFAAETWTRKYWKIVFYLDRIFRADCCLESGLKTNKLRRLNKSVSQKSVRQKLEILSKFKKLSLVCKPLLQGEATAVIGLFAWFRSVAIKTFSCDHNEQHVHSQKT